MPGNRTEQCLYPIALAAALLGGVSSGCGAPAAPLPPTLNLPQPVRDLAATRVGNTVRLSFTVPQKTTDKLPVRGSMTVKLCRSVDSGPCDEAGSVAIAPGQKAVSMDDTLTAALTQGAPRLLTYRVTVQNRAAKAADPSNSAYAAAGVAPVPVANFSVTPRRNGIVLAWQGAGTPVMLRVDRTRTSTPSQTGMKQQEKESFVARKNTEEPAEQVLRIAENASASAAGHLFQAVDATAHTGNGYRYTAQRVVSLTLSGHDLTIGSVPTAPVSVEYRDVFPPPIPAGLVSAADTGSKSIDLDWTPDVDPGLAGYIVYRRPAGSSQSPQQISPAGTPVTASNYSDTTAQAGQRYAYSVSAIDNSGNESQRSAEVEDEWIAPSPNPQP